MNKKETAKLISENQDRKYYVYALLRPNGEVFYVGKGTGVRIFGHEKENGNKLIKHHIISKIKKQGLRISYHIFGFFSDEKTAYQLEISLIQKYGKITSGGILSNLTDGGEGWSGGKHSKETIKLLSAKLTEMRADPEYRKRRSEIAKETAKSPLFREKVRQGMYKYNKNNPEEAKLIREKQAKAMRSPETREKIRHIIKEYYQNVPGAREKNSEAVKKYYQETPGAIEKNRKAVKAAMSKPEVKEKLSRAQKIRHQKMPEGEWSERQTKVLSRPSTREKMSNSAKNRVVEKICKYCKEIYFKKAVNKHNKDTCDKCRSNKPIIRIPYR